MILVAVLFVVLVTALANGNNEALGLDLSRSCHNMTWACHDLETCFRCQKLDGCVEIWQQISAPQDNNEQCGICNNIVKQAKQKMLTDESQNFDDILETSCKEQTTDGLRNKCYGIIDEIGLELADVLTSDVDCNTLCTLAGFCNGGNGLKLIREQYIVSSPMMAPTQPKVEQKAKFDLEMGQFLTQNDFIKVLVNACANHSKENVGRCEGIVHKLGPLFYSFIKYMPKVINGDSMNCDLCQSVLGYVKGILDSSSTKEDCKTELTNLCGYLKELATECKSLVDEYFEKIYEFLVNQIDPLQACTMLHLCDEENLRVVSVPVVKDVPLVSSYLLYTSVRAVRVDPLYNRANAVRGAVETDSVKTVVLAADSNGFITCEICKTVMSYLHKKLGENRTDEAIRKALSKVCNVVPRHWRNKCSDFMASHMDLIVDLLKHAADPSTICKVILVCLSEPEGHRPTPGIGDTDDKENKISVLEPESKDLLTCEICKQVMAYLEKELGDNRTEEAIREALDKACNVLPRHWRSKCTDFVDSHVDVIVELLQNEVSPEMVCKALGVCTSEHRSLVSHRTETEDNRLSVLEPESKDPLTCEVCKQVMAYLEKELGDNRTEEAIRKALDKVCNVLPRHWRSKCTDFVDSHVDLIVDLLQHEVSPEMVCNALGVCSSEPPNRRLASHRTQTEDNKLSGGAEQRLRLPVKHLKNPSLTDAIPSCKVCKTLITFVNLELKGEKNKDVILTALDDGCKIFPKDMQRQCQTFVDENVDTLVTLIIQGSSPKAMCSIFKACSAGHGSKSNDFITCEVCKAVMEYLDKELGDNRTEEAIRKALDKVCDILPRHWRGKCTSFVDKYADQIVELLEKAVAPSMVCKALGVCFLEPEHHRHLLHRRERELEKTRS